MMFGDTNAYQDKFKTCARTRPINCVITKRESAIKNTKNPYVIKPCIQCASNKNKKLVKPLCCQILGEEFYAKESTKPLFKLHKLLTVHNLYKLRTITELFKIMKYRLPMSLCLYSLFTRSERRDNRFKTPKPTHNFVYKSSWLWNKYLNTDKELDFTKTCCNSLKTRLNISLIAAQNRYFNDWHKDNFQEFGPLIFNFETFTKSKRNIRAINQTKRRHSKKC